MRSSLGLGGATTIARSITTARPHADTVLSARTRWRRRRHAASALFAPQSTVTLTLLCRETIHFGEKTVQVSGRNRNGRICSFYSSILRRNFMPRLLCVYFSYIIILPRLPIDVLINVLSARCIRYIRRHALRTEIVSKLLLRKFNERKSLRSVNLLESIALWIWHFEEKLHRHYCQRRFVSFTSRKSLGQRKIFQRKDHLKGLYSSLVLGRINESFMRKTLIHPRGSLMRAIKPRHVCLIVTSLIRGNVTKLSTFIFVIIRLSVFIPGRKHRCPG